MKDEAEVDVFVHGHSGKAYLLSVDGERKNAEWVPASLCTFDKPPKIGSTTLVSIPQWKAEELGFV